MKIETVDLHRVVFVDRVQTAKGGSHDVPYLLRLSGAYPGHREYTKTFCVDSTVLKAIVTGLLYQAAKNGEATTIMRQIAAELEEAKKRLT